MIFIAIGSNLPAAGEASPIATCRRAVNDLARLPALRLIGVSPWYVTAPVPASDQPDYINGVAALSGGTEPGELLRRLQAVEAMHGRVREGATANVARRLDLDIIDIGGVLRTGPDPVLPHPRAHLRGFVLYPLADLAPDWMHPSLGRRVRDLIASLPPQHIRLWSAQAGTDLVE